MLRRRCKWLVYGVILAVVMIMSGCGEPVKLNEQQQGMKLYNALCDRCHNRINPTAHSDEEWHAAVMRYGVKLNLQQQELNAIVAYLTIANDTI